MTDFIRVEIQNDTKVYPKGVTLKQLSEEYQRSCPAQIVAAKVNNRLRELTYSLQEDCKVEFVDRTCEDGVRIYVRSLTFLFIRACKELFPDCRICVEHSLGSGLYCEVHGNFTLTPSLVKQIEEKMREIVALDEPFERFEVSISRAREIFLEMGFEDKLEILKYRPEDTVHLYRCGWMVDYLYGYMVPSTGYLTKFELKFYLPGVIIRYPGKDRPEVILPFEDRPKLFRVFREAEKWAELIDVKNVAQLNRLIEEGRGSELIRICEARQEKLIAQIADKIAKQKDRIRVILIAGPSSSGKTTFAQRLRIQLMVNGLNPVSISIDNYFLEHDKIPAGEGGERDLESIDAIDIELFNEHLSALIQGREVEIPYFNFETGKREYRGYKIRIDENQPVIIEGIHGLNEKLTAMIPAGNKYKIYVSALTQLNIDDHNRISTSDTRLVRRLVRDSKFRGTPVGDTLRMWPSVRRGEEKYIFPFQESADIMFNSAMVYELAVLKPFILPMLKKIDRQHPLFIEANRLVKFLKYFRDLDSGAVPNTSILREFIGGSCFY